MTPRHLAFVAAFTLTRNGKRAAIAAGYSAKTAAAAASRLRRHPEVAAAIEKLRGASRAHEPLSALAYLLGVVNDPDATTPRRIRAALAAARYVHARPSAGGQKGTATTRGKDCCRRQVCARCCTAAPGAAKQAVSAMRTVELLLAACEACGALRLRDLYREVAELAGDREFTSSESIAHAEFPRNYRLRRALVAMLGPDYSAGKLGKLLALHAGIDLAHIAISPIGEEANAMVWSCRSRPDFVAAGEE